MLGNVFQTQLGVKGVLELELNWDDVYLDICKHCRP